MELKFIDKGLTLEDLLSIVKAHDTKQTSILDLSGNKLKLIDLPKLLAEHFPNIKVLKLSRNSKPSQYVCNDF
jgi:hypothetical protein